MKITSRTERMTKKKKEEYEKEGCVLLVVDEKIIYTPDEKKVMKSLTRNQAEKIFDVSLKGRTFNLGFTAFSGKHKQYAELTFNDKNNCFGYIEKVPIKEFWNSYKRLLLEYKN